MKILTMLLTLCAFAGGGGDDDKGKLELRLKPNVSVRGLDVTVAELCELSPSGGQAVSIGRLRFGPAPTNGFARNVTRTELVQTLAAAGVDLTTVKIVGADEAMVQAIVVDVSGQEMLDAAAAALQAQLQLEGGDVEVEAPRNLKLVQAPPGRQSLEMSARVRGNQTGPNGAVVDVDLLVDGQSFRKVPVQFRLQRYRTVLKTVTPIRQGSPLGPDNIALVREAMDQGSSMWLDRFEQVDGQQASRNLQPGQRLTLGDVAPPALVHRGDIVTVVLTRGRVKVTSRAVANEDAPLGGRVTLTNLESRGLITGVVHGAGLVVVQQ
ncbi:MAG: flagellar basal body P-ring formation chaperone FlgA [Planctomycetes bacterium]|nr:flagellar basal body P-ring formation chaperone FlgA [Planctomycetota bacterium]MCC7396804.1 flagellar basal body P-ring formation protein FlgA [Planctomycetota bacterium]